MAAEINTRVDLCFELKKGKHEWAQEWAWLTGSKGARPAGLALF